MLAGLLALARAPVELAEAEVAVGDERAHAQRLGEGQGLAIVGLGALGVEAVGMGRDVAEQVQSWAPPRLTREEFERAVAQASGGLVQPADQEIGLAQRG